MILQDSDYEYIQDLASKGYTAKAIALLLDVSVSEFHFCAMDLNHDIGKAYNLGILETEQKKREVLTDKILDKKSETAILIHDKKKEIQHFLDVKNEIFNPFINK